MFSRKMLEKATAVAAGVMITVVGLPCAAVAGSQYNPGVEPQSTISIRGEGKTVATSAEDLFAGQLIVPQDSVTASVTVQNDTAATVWSVLELARKQPVGTSIDETLSLSVRGNPNGGPFDGRDCSKTERSTVKLVPGETQTFDLSVSLSDLRGQTGQRAVTSLELHSFSTTDQLSDLCGMTLPATETPPDVPAGLTISTVASSLSLTGQETRATHGLVALAALSVVAGAVLIVRHRRRRHEKRTR